MDKCFFFFATSRVSGLASIVTAIKFSHISAGVEPGGGARAPQHLHTLRLRACTIKQDFEFQDPNDFTWHGHNKTSGINSFRFVVYSY